MRGRAAPRPWEVRGGRQPPKARCCVIYTVDRNMVASVKMTPAWLCSIIPKVDNSRLPNNSLPPLIILYNGEEAGVKGGKLIEV